MEPPRPSIFISYSQDSLDHSGRVRSLAERLVVEGGFDCRLDQWIDAPPEGWPVWCDSQLDEVDFILVVCTESYYRKAKGLVVSGVGHGARFESVLTVQLLYDSGMVSDRVVPILFEELDPEWILRPLRPFSRYRVDHEEGFQDLVRRLWGARRFQRPELGPVPDFDRPEESRSEERVRRGAHPTPEPLTQTAEAPTSNLPESVGLFVGREEELAQVADLLVEHRFVTLVGPPGCGKTRLAEETVRRILDRFPDGIWLTRLADLEDSILVPQAIARSLGLSEQAPKPPTQILADAVGDKHLLLVLDNCEHLAAACAEVVKELLEKCPRAKVLATSRGRLFQGSGEHVWDVPPMQVPPPGVSLQPASLLRYESVSLFVQLGQSVARGKDFQITRENSVAIARICRQLDGIPLALELAAAQLEYLTAPKIAEHLDQALRLLKRSKRSALSQHRTLTATLEWSYRLLEPRAQRLFARLGIFVGGCTLEDAAEVCGDEGEFSLDLLEPLERLINQSLLQRQDSGEEPRFGMLEVIRQYSQAWLQDSGEQEAIERRFRDRYLALAEEAAPNLLGKQQDAWLHRLETEHANLRSALKLALRQGANEQALRLGAALWRFWEIHGYLNEGRRRLGQLLELSADLYQSLHAKGLAGATTLAYRQGDLAAAQELASRALAVETDLGNPRGIANALNDLGIVANKHGRLEEAHDYYQRALELKRIQDDDREMGVAHNNLGNVYQRLGRSAEARRELLQSVRRFEAAGNRWETGFPLYALGYTALSDEDLVEARSFWNRSLEARTGAGDKRGMGDALTGLALAETLLDNVEQARGYLETAFEHRFEVGDSMGKLESIEAMAHWTERIGQREASLELISAVDRLREEVSFPPTPVIAEVRRRLVERLKAHFDPATFEALVASGQRMTLGAVVASCRSLLGEGG